MEAGDKGERAEKTTGGRNREHGSRILWVVGSWKIGSHQEPSRKGQKRGTKGRDERKGQKEERKEGTKGRDERKG